MTTDTPQRTDAAWQGRGDPFRRALHQAAIAEAERILTADEDTMSLEDVLELERVMFRIADELVS